MDRLSVNVVRPGGRQQRLSLPADATVNEVLAYLAARFDLPTHDPAGSPVDYHLYSKQRAGMTPSDQTLREARIVENDTLLITFDIMAAAASVAQSPRMRRLYGDYERMKELDSRSDLIDVKVVGGMPPERYIVTYNVNSIIGVDRRGEPKMGNRHQVEVYLHSEYPQRWPGLKWLSPIWHPNINHLNGSVCIDAAWWGAARSLDQLVIMMGEMLQYKNFHDDPTKPPYPWDKEAAEWCRAYRTRHPGIFPTDKRELLRPSRVKFSLKDRATAAVKKRGGIKLGAGKPKKKSPRVKLKG